MNTPLVEKIGDRWTSTSALRNLLDGLLDAAIVIEPERRVLAWNQAYADLVGTGLRRLQRAAAEPGCRCCDLFELEVCAQGCLARRCLETGRTLRMDEVAGSSAFVPQAEKRVLIVSAAPIRDAEGNVVAVLESFRDVTAEAQVQERYKVLLEEERRRAETLEGLVRERTRDLERSLEQLRATKEQLVRSEKLSAVGQLVAGLAHEINNPLNFVYGNLDFLDSHVQAYRKLLAEYERCGLNAEAQELIAEVKEDIEFDYIEEDIVKLIRSMRTGAERAIGIIRDLRSFIRSGDKGLAPVDPVRCLESTLSLLVHECKGRIEIRRELEPNIPEVLANEGQLGQVFMNLLVNATQAIQGNGTITVGAQQRGDIIAVWVEDDGIGMSEETLTKVFDPFFTTKAVGTGTGLGLSISYGLIEGVGGRIVAESEPGRGSVFTVMLPLGGAPGASGE